MVFPPSGVCRQGPAAVVAYLRTNAAEQVAAAPRVRPGCAHRAPPTQPLLRESSDSAVVAADESAADGSRVPRRRAQSVALTTTADDAASGDATPAAPVSPRLTRKPADAALDVAAPIVAPRTPAPAPHSASSSPWLEPSDDSPQVGARVCALRQCV